MRYDSAARQLRDYLKGINLDSIVRHELSLNKRFSLFELSDEVLIAFDHGERGGQQSMMHVGFPFPMESSDFNADLNGLKIDAFIRGEPVRRIQRAAVKKMSQRYEEKQIGFEREFRDMAGSPARIVYLDPYTFIGDSFIGLHFLDSFAHTFGVAKSIIFSNQHKHLASLNADIHDYTPEQVAKSVREGDLVVAPDLIDTHWSKTLMTLRELRGKGVTVAIPARGLAMHMGAEGMRTVHYDLPDTLLRDKNIEDYMDDCLAQFGVRPHSVAGEKRFNDTSRFFLNPFTSQELRYISPGLMLHTYKRLKELDRKAEFHLIAGYHKSRNHVDWLNQFLNLMQQDGAMHRVSINYYADLNELAEHLQERECSAILTADTSVAHVANRLGYANVCVYNPMWWDSHSLQSMSASSPAGFCRYFHHQMPVLNRGNSHEEIALTAEIISSAMMFFQQPLDKQIEAYKDGKVSGLLKDMYNSECLTWGIAGNPRGSHLRASAIKVSPRYKMEALKCQ